MDVSISFVMWFKIGWALFVAICVVAHYRAMREAYIDLRFVMKDHSPEREPDRIHAMRSLRMQFVLFAFQSMLLSIRFWALWWPDPGNPIFAKRWAADGTIISLGQMLLGYNALLDTRDRHRTIEALPPPSAAGPNNFTTPDAPPVSAFQSHREA